MGRPTKKTDVSGYIGSRRPLVPLHTYRRNLLLLISLGF